MDDLLAGGITSKALMALYQADVLDEEVAKQWGTHASKKYVDKDKSKKVRKGADAFLKVSLLVLISANGHQLISSGSTRRMMNPTKSRRVKSSWTSACFLPSGIYLSPNDVVV